MQHIPVHRTPRFCPLCGKTPTELPAPNHDTFECPEGHRLIIQARLEAAAALWLAGPRSPRLIIIRKADGKLYLPRGRVRVWETTQRAAELALTQQGQVNPGIFLNDHFYEKANTAGVLTTYFGGTVIAHPQPFQVSAEIPERLILPREEVWMRGILALSEDQEAVDVWCSVERS